LFGGSEVLNPKTAGGLQVIYDAGDGEKTIGYGHVLTKGRN